MVCVDSVTRVSTYVSLRKNAVTSCTSLASLHQCIDSVAGHCAKKTAARLRSEKKIAARLRSGVVGAPSDVLWRELSSPPRKCTSSVGRDTAHLKKSSPAHGSTANDMNAMCGLRDACATSASRVVLVVSYLCERVTRATCPPFVYFSEGQTRTTSGQAVTHTPPVTAHRPSPSRAATNTCVAYHDRYPMAGASSFRDRRRADLT